MRVKLQVEMTSRKHSVTLGNWITIIFYVKSIDKLMLIIFHYLSYLNLQFTLNKMKS